MKTRYAVLVALLLALPAAWVRAQPAPRRDRGELAKLIDAYIVSNLQEHLRLTDDQFVKMLPLLKRLQDDRRGLVRRRILLLDDLRRQLRSGSPDETRLREGLARLKELDDEQHQTLREDMNAIDAVLSPAQQAGFRLFEVEVERRIREMVSRARSRGAGREPPPRRER